jgi:1,2-diacylglycerol-3-alpha-glucose alpha-1,2-galactosyltransferase
MLSKADMVKGQGVGSAYIEQVRLIRDGTDDIFDIKINDYHKADIIHCHTVGLINYLRMKKNKGVSVSYVHFLPDTLDGSIKLPRLLQNIFKKYVIRFYKKADYLVVVNPIFIKDLKRYGIKEERIKYIPNYVDKENFYKKNSKDRESIRKKMNINKYDFVVVGVGQVQTRKGVLDFIEVAKKVPDILFIWCGGFSFGNITDGYKELKKAIDSPPANARFLGIVPRNEMNDIYNAADVLFMPSYNELFPMSILEAANVKIPILLRDIDTYKDILFDNYMKSNTNDSFAELIRILKHDEHLYNEYSIKSNNISNFYSKDNVKKMWCEFYKNIYKNKK